MTINGTLSGYAKSSHGHSTYLYKSASGSLSTGSSKTLSVKAGDIVVFTGYGSGGGTYVCYVASAAAFVHAGTGNSTNTVSQITIANLVPAKLSSGTFTLTCIDAWLVMYYWHYKVV